MTSVAFIFVNLWTQLLQPLAISLIGSPGTLHATGNPRHGRTRPVMQLQPGHGGNQTNNKKPVLVSTVRALPVWIQNQKKMGHRDRALPGHPITAHQLYVFLKCREGHLSETKTYPGPRNR